MFKRFRRLRASNTIRNLVRETILTPDDFMYPLFVKEGLNEKIEIKSMPGVYQMGINDIVKECGDLQGLGLNSILLFAIPKDKDSIGSECLKEDSMIATTIKAIKKVYPNMHITTDLCFCEYTDHGHCGIVDSKTNNVNNDATLEISAQQALIHAKAGADMIAPSGMMDGIITTLRTTLDKNGFENLPIMAYSTKFASAFYGPFRDVAESSPNFGNRKTYQMDVANRLEAIEESLEDEKEGADILMVKPALSFLDIIRDIRNNSNLPIAAYNVSGEYAMLKLAGANKLVNYDEIMMEKLLSMKRAGATVIITYHAKEASKIINNK
ncbi:Porphobilinogen synthase [hydrothermal vent metagenome]|uniref:Delta-aminolevulinic acid dehydratase n=1 Tax=hydrothermal vent metagenome TaxID=652676 RepID=A0A3B1E4N0_9ZZZZ